MKYVVIRKQKEEKLANHKVEINGLSVLPVNRVPNLSIKAKKVILVDKELQSGYVREKINRKIDKIIKFMLRILDSDDDASEDTGLVLDEVNKFKGIVINKYKAYLSIDEYKSYLAKLIMLEDEFKKNYNQKIFNSYMSGYYVDETNKRGR